MVKEYIKIDPVKELLKAYMIVNGRSDEVERIALLWEIERDRLLRSLVPNECSGAGEGWCSENPDGRSCR